MPFKVGFVSGAVLLGSFALSAIHPWGNQRAGVKPQAQLLQNSNVPEGGAPGDREKVRRLSFG